MLIGGEGRVRVCIVSWGIYIYIFYFIFLNFVFGFVFSVGKVREDTLGLRGEEVLLKGGR